MLKVLPPTLQHTHSCQIPLQWNLDYPDLVYPDMLNSANYINMHAQRA